MNAHTVFSPPQWGGLKKFGWCSMLALSFALFDFTGRYSGLNPEVFFVSQKAIYVAHPLAIWLHVAGSMLAIAMGPALFLPVTRKPRWLNLHRWLGRTYLLGVVIGACLGLYLS